MPVLLWLFRTLRLRADEAPALAELGWIVGVWAVLFEWIGPRAFHHATGDWRDVAMYFAGGLAAWVFWRARSQRTSPEVIS